MTVVLIGPPAAGKTRLGRRLAKRLGVAFIDTDRVIVDENGPIATIFAEHGEPYFRRLERTVVAAALRSGGVVSLGGGAVLDAETQADLATATVIQLTVTADAVADRITGGKRPLVTSIESWRALADARAPLYASLADYTTDTSARPASAIVDELARWVESRGTEGNA